MTLISEIQEKKKKIFTSLKTKIVLHNLDDGRT